MSNIDVHTEQQLSSIGEPLISVIIPTYNRLSFLKEAIGSVQSQTYTKWELIVVDDGSTDGTVDAIQNLNDSRIQIVALSHTGHISYVMNKGVKKSKGEWLAFLDSDDLWLPEKLEWQLETIRKKNKKWAYGLFDYIDENKNMIYRSSEKFNSYEGKIIKEVILGKTGITVCSILIEKKLFEKVGGFSPDPSVRNDYEFLLRLSLNAETAVTNEVVLLVRDHPNRTYKSRVYPHERSALTYKAFIDQKPGKEFKKLARSHLAFLLSEASVHRFAAGYYSIGLKQLCQSLWMRDKIRHWLSALKRGIYAAFKKYFYHSAKKRKAEDVAAYHS